MGGSVSSPLEVHACCVEGGEVEEHGDESKWQVSLCAWV